MEDTVDESESLTSPLNMSQKREEEEEEEEEKEKGDEVRGKKDAIEEKEEAGVEATEEGEKGESEGGILNNLLSNIPGLPVSLPDDAVPATDEASLLISIIHD